MTPPCPTCGQPATMLTDAERDEGLALLAKATPLPWQGWKAPVEAVRTRNPSRRFTGIELSVEDSALLLWLRNHAASLLSPPKPAADDGVGR